MDLFGLLLFDGPLNGFQGFEAFDAVTFVGTIQNTLGQPLETGLRLKPLTVAKCKRLSAFPKAGYDALMTSLARPLGKRAKLASSL